MPNHAPTARITRKEQIAALEDHVKRIIVEAELIGKDLDANPHSKYHEHEEHAGDNIHEAIGYLRLAKGAIFELKRIEEKELSE